MKRSINLILILYLFLILGFFLNADPNGGAFGDYQGHIGVINDFKNDFEILSVLRNLKIIGIFTRLAIRDNKKKYLKMIPLAWELIETRINNNIIFYNLKKNLDNNFSTKCRKKK